MNCVSNVLHEGWFYEGQDLNTFSLLILHQLIKIIPNFNLLYALIKQSSVFPEVFNHFLLFCCWNKIQGFLTISLISSSFLFIQSEAWTLFPYFYWKHSSWNSLTFCCALFLFTLLHQSNKKIQNKDCLTSQMKGI